MQLKKISFLLVVIALSLSFCDVSLAATINPGISIGFTNPLQFSTVEDILGSLLDALQGIIIVISLVFIIIGAIFYITSAGDEKKMTMAKSAVTASMIGLAIGIAAPAFLKQISTIIGWAPATFTTHGTTLTLTQIALNTLEFLLAIVGTLALIMLLVGGIMYLTSAGDEERITTGKKIFNWSIIGITIALAAMVIVRQIAGFFE